MFVTISKCRRVTASAKALLFRFERVIPRSVRPSCPFPRKLFACGGSQFESLADSFPFDPEYLAGLSRCNQQFTTAQSRNLPIRKPVLEFHHLFHADGPKTVTCAPVAEYNPVANFVRIKKLHSFDASSEGLSAHGNSPPVDPGFPKNNFTRRPLQISRELIRVEFIDREFLQCHCAQTVMNRACSGAYDHRRARRTAQ